LDGVPMVPHADEPFDESVMALVPKSMYAPLPDNFSFRPGQPMTSDAAHVDRVESAAAPPGSGRAPDRLVDAAAAAS
jgi:hypothetical protein